MADTNHATPLQIDYYCKLEAARSLTMSQTEVKLCEVCWSKGTATRAYWFLSTLPVCEDHYQCVCGRCKRRWATKTAREGEDYFFACDQCYEALERQQARREAYSQHLDSKQWWKTKRNLRRESFREHGKVACSRCAMSECDNKQKYGERLHGHHRTYERFGQEKTEDLELLCSWCHAWEHGQPAPKPITVSDGSLLPKRVQDAKSGTAGE
jgi:YHS domain-containing protein